MRDLGGLKSYNQSNAIPDAAKWINPKVTPRDPDEDGQVPGDRESHSPAQMLRSFVNAQRRPKCRFGWPITEIVDLYPARLAV